MKKCEICGREFPAEQFSKSYKNRCKECVAILEREKRKNKQKSVSSSEEDSIDWEQRRYELSSSIYRDSMRTIKMQSDATAYETMQAAAFLSIGAADVFLKMLKSFDKKK